MNPLRIFLILAGLLVAMPGIVHAQKDQGADSQFWSETRLVYKIDPKVNIFTAGAYRLTKNFSDFQRVSGRFGGSWSPIPSLSITPSYFYTVGNPFTTAPRSESRLCLLTAYRIPIKATMLTLANTTEYRMPESKPDSWWLRPKFRVQHPVGPDSWKLDAFVGDEVFYDNRRVIFTQDQVVAGLEKKFNDTLTIDFFYCRRIPLNDVTSPANALCLDFRITFGKPGPGPFEPSLR